MSHRRTILLVLLSLALGAYAAEKQTIRIKVLDSETHSVVIDNSGVPKNCDQVNFDAYCNNSKTTQVTNTMLVQEGDEAPYRISCSVDSKWSRCIPLSRGETFEAKRQKRGLIVYYVDDNGKARSQLYAVIAGKMPQLTNAAAQPAPSSPPQPSSVVQPAAPSISTPAMGVAAPIAEGQGSPIKCNFSSIPSGADITVDGKYVGSTPSEVALTTGTHVVVFTMAGFSQWSRELTVTPGSGAINVAASLQKMP
jgi:hypothetical protein